MRIAFFNPYGDGLYGATHSLVRLLRNWGAPDKLIVFTVDNSEVRESLADHVASIEELRLMRLRLWNAPKLLLYAWQTARKLRRLSVDLVVWNGGYLGLPFAWLIKRLCGIPYITVMRDLVISKSTNKAARYLNNAAGIICVSKAIQSSMNQAAGGRLATRQLVLYDPLPMVLMENQNYVRQQSQFRPVVAMFGYICHLKGQDLLVEAASLVSREHPNTEYWIVGAVREGVAKDREYLAILNRRIAELGLSGKFRFFGYQRDVLTLMRQCTAVAIPSRRESFGMVAIEAWSQAVPTVAMDTGGLGETHRSSGGGILFRAESTPALAEAICRLLRDPTDNEQTGRNGFLWVQENSNPALYVGEFRHFVSECIGHKIQDQSCIP